jgi:hypothetical protein
MKQEASSSYVDTMEGMGLFSGTGRTGGVPRLDCYYMQSCECCRIIGLKPRILGQPLERIRLPRHPSTFRHIAQADSVPSDVTFPARRTF